jgi:hypothetical protein
VYTVSHGTCQRKSPFMQKEDSPPVTRACGWSRACDAPAPVATQISQPTFRGAQILFGGRHEHVCTYGPSRLTITVVCSRAALVRFGKCGLTPSQVAVYAVSGRCFWDRWLAPCISYSKARPLPHATTTSSIKCRASTLGTLECGRLCKAC